MGFHVVSFLDICVYVLYFVSVVRTHKFFLKDCLSLGILKIIRDFWRNTNFNLKADDDDNREMMEKLSWLYHKIAKVTS